MRSIKRVYQVAPFSTEEVKRKLEESNKERLKKRMRAQHADWNGAEVVACTETTAGWTRSVRHQPSWADENDPVYGDKGKEDHKKKMQKL